MQRDSISQNLVMISSSVPAGHDSNSDLGGIARNGDYFGFGFFLSNQRSAETGSRHENKLQRTFYFSLALNALSDAWSKTTYTTGAETIYTESKGFQLTLRLLLYQKSVESFIPDALKNTI